MIFYEFNPLDTLFFRGSTPMEAGLSASDSVFPPPVSVIKGAVRTALMKQNKIPLNRENGEKINFDVVAVLIKKSGNCYAPSPATWYVACRNKKEEATTHFTGNTILEARPLDNSLTTSLGIMSSEGDVPFVAGTEKGCEPISLGGAWINVKLLLEKRSTIKEGDILFEKDMYAKEARTGVGLDSRKHTVDGMLYSANHIRLKEDVSIVVCLSGEPEFEGKNLAQSGVIQLGGEKRLCKYEKTAPIEFTEPADSKNFICLVPVEATEEIIKNIVASGKIKTSAGWDLAAGFHKATTNWIPAGAVFSEKINEFCFALAGRK